MREKRRSLEQKGLPIKGKALPSRHHIRVVKTLGGERERKREGG